MNDIKTTASRSEYKGHPMIQLSAGGPPFSFGLAKAKLILASIQDIEAFVKDSEKPR